ncbi:solid-state culture-specific ATP-grasp domain protein [Aspergillus novofumigatus IBT 16806]|uniref:Solid-state culture-specific ATP-grasp domain protein n=1 Tax=Aspergillus novofumigatus (strain IBT 16806) TaxID=1392255 RepID=A0A2I1BVB3_ASPN1|nr:solid-state culture-specific ATP-grasp domain protein [Aspergillus novofumigatus IBT 16806]PKX89333.1 solid-state culture-specific ATP-grasp domain protein [Aspergillus novofumigatus IBT 16806]
MDSTPLIRLDYTLYDLYSMDSEGWTNITLVYSFMHESAVKFTYQYELQGMHKAAQPSGILEMKLRPQRHGFIAGKMPLAILEADSQCNDQALDTLRADHADVFRNFAQLSFDQQPVVSFATSSKSIPVEPGAHIAVMFPSDCVLHLQHLVDPEIHYELLSKPGLAMSGLPTPPSKVIDTVLTPHEVHDQDLLRGEISRITQLLDNHELPFVLKLPQSASGLGVFKVLTDAQRTDAKAILAAQLGRMLQKINESNHHMRPCSLVIQDFIQGTTMGLSLFVTKKGRPIFIACCDQQLDEHGHWIGSSISYKRQPELKETYRDISEKIAAFLHAKGYYGPVGVDIITNVYGNQYIVDLNARVTGSYHLGPLAGHFLQRGLLEVTFMQASFLYSRAAFEAAFSDELQRGTLVICGWAHAQSIPLSQAAINIGGRDSSEVEETLKKIKDFAAPVCNM